MMEIAVILLLVTAAALIDAWRDQPARVERRRWRGTRWETLPPLAPMKHVGPFAVRTSGVVVRYPASVKFLTRDDHVVCRYGHGVVSFKPGSIIYGDCI